MKIACLYLSVIDFDPLTPESTPLGGMQSAVCYRSRELARRGHEITLFNGSTGEGTIEGINVRNYERRFGAEGPGHDAYISISCSGRLIRPVIGNQPLILLTGHNSLEPSMQALRDPGERNCWDHFVFKSSWQAESLRQAFSLDEHKVTIITNAVSPFFERLEERQSFFFLENRPPVLYYSSTPFRGLEVLARAFPKISKACPGITAKIFSSMAPYHTLGSDDEHAALYELCRQNGMDYVGSLSQPDLAKAVQAADILAFPSTYAETSCITVMEAMANSAVIVSRARGAIPETSAGFANLMPEPERPAQGALPSAFANHVIEVVKAAGREPQHQRAWLQRARRYCLKNYSWPAKAREWEDVLQRAVKQAEQADRNTGGTQPAQPAICHYVQTESGAKLYLNPHDGRAQRMLQHGGSFNPATAFLWRSALAMGQWNTIADVGANYGEMLFEDGVRRCERVLAFEPSPLVLPYLAKTTNGARNIRIVPVALSDRAGETRFSVNRQWSGMSKLGDGPNQIRVRVMTLDSILGTADAGETRPLRLLLKVDVEGGDVDVLKGAALTIARAAEFCCLIEVAHIAAADARWLEQFFSIHALSFREGRVVEIDGLGALGDKARFWHQDVILRRKPQQRPAPGR